MKGFLSKLLGDPNKKVMNRLQPLIYKINTLEPEFEKLSDSKLAEKTKEFRERLNKNETLDDLLPEAFAAVREAAKRTIKQRHFDVQLAGGIVLYQGKIAEMKTGEGKTLAATLPLYLRALEGQSAHLVTVNDYLARRDCSWMGPIYDLLGLSVSAINHEKSYLFSPKVKEGDERPETVEYENLKECTRKEAYSADITYGTNNEFGFDYLRDNMVADLKQMVQRDLHYAIVDEVDSILIDEARTPLIISAPAEESGDYYRQFARMLPNLKKEVDYTVDEKAQAVSLTDAGIKQMEKMLGVKNIYESKGVTLVHHLEQALRAEVLFKKDRDYVVREGEVIIVDQFTGRLMPGRRYSEGLHQAIEAKEEVEVKRESITLATISFQNYFRMYKTLAGMTGTAATEEEEFYKIYGLEVVVVPTNKAMIRSDVDDAIYSDEQAKFQAVVHDIQERNKKGQPILVGTIAIEKSEVLSEMLKREGIAHEVLNAKHHEKEAQIIAQAGKIGGVTVATNMAGRGVDIILGGSPFNQKEYEKVKKMGGLHVLGTERHEARRIDNQLRGRSGRQGDPGTSQFYVSMEDDLMRIFGGDRLKGIMSTLRVPENMPIRHPIISRSIEQAQKRVEGHNFDIRKHLVEYDDVANIHRQTIYRLRREILENKDLKEKILGLMKDEVIRLVDLHAAGNPTEWNKKEIEEGFKTILGRDEAPVFKIDWEKYGSSEGLKKDLSGLLKQLYDDHEKKIGSEILRQIERAIYLRSIDTLWVEHLTTMEELREGIGLRGYGQRDPLVEYKAEAYRLFQVLQASIGDQVIHMVFKVELAVQPPQIAARAAQNIEEKGGDEQAAAGTFAQQRAASGAVGETGAQRAMRAESSRVSLKSEKVGRNQPCPCGSGKKYKKCCGR